MPSHYLLDEPSLKSTSYQKNLYTQKTNINYREKQAIGFGRGVAPFSTIFEENQVLNRQFIELGGYLPSDVLVARNKFELREKLLDHGFWIGVAVLSPLLLGKVLTKILSKNFSQFGINPPKLAPISQHLSNLQKAAAWIERLGKQSPLQVPFEYLVAEGRFTKNKNEMKTITENLGLKDIEALEKLLKNKEFKNKVILGKLIILGVDLALMAFNGQFKMWFKNVMTEKSSGQEGFSGTFNYASKSYLKKDNADYQQNKRKRLLTSISLALGSILGLPLIMLALLKSKAPLGKGLIGNLKKLIPAFNYADTIFMSKWTFLWYSTFNYVLAGALSARGKHERREHLVKALTLDFFFVFGDLLVSGLGAAALQNLLKNKLKGVKLLKPNSLLARPLKEIFEQVGKSHPAYRWAQHNYWLGLISTTGLIALSIPIANNYYTKQKVLREQAEQARADSKSNPPHLSILNTRNTPLRKMSQAVSA